MTSTTQNHRTIRQWAEARGGHPARADGGVLRFDFGEHDEGLEQIGWDEFFRIFDDRHLYFLYQDRTGDGSTSRFNKFVAGPS